MKKIDIYTTEIIFNEQGIPCKVIDISKLDFTKCAKGRKSKITLVKIAKGGEKIFTFGNDGKIESTTIAKMGDAIFCNSATDVYIPADKNGHWKYYDIEKYGYEIVNKMENCCTIKSKNFAYLIFDLIKEPSCIKDAFGDGANQFLFDGAVIKKDINTGNISGISADSFKDTWEIFNEKI